MLPMILIPNHGHNSAAKLINSYLIRNFYALYFPLISVFNFEGLMSCVALMSLSEEFKEKRMVA